jgi:tetratricopeptide (TPR) repeat protein
VRGLRVLLGALLVAGLAAAAVGASAAVADSPDDAAIAFYRERMARDPGDHLTPVSLGAVYLRKARASGDLAFAARAGEAAERSLALQSDHAPALVLLAAIRSAEHRFPEALALAERALARDPTSPDGWAVLADARLNVGDLAAARTAIAALDARVSGVQSLGRLALWRAATGDDEGAIAEWTGALVAGEAQGAGPADLAWAHLERGGLHHSRGRLAAAEADYLRARELDPEGWRAEARLAGLRGTQQRWDEAIERYERLAARAPRPEIWHALGDLHRFVGRPKDAAPWLDRAEAGYREVADRGGASTYHHLAAFYADIRVRPAEAIVWARKDLALRRTSATYDALAWALHLNGDADEARASIERALATGAKEPHLLMHAAAILGRAGEHERSAQLLLEAHRRSPLLREFHVHH